MNKKYFLFLDRFTMGQNLAIIWSTAQLAENDGDFPSRIQNWFNEVQKYAWGAQWSAATGHYSQVSRQCVQFTRGFLQKYFLRIIHLMRKKVH